jgi:hypothetical protein
LKIALTDGNYHIVAYGECNKIERLGDLLKDPMFSKPLRIDIDERLVIDVAEEDTF